MENARYFCKQRHGDLVTINSEAERVFLWQQVNSDTYSILYCYTAETDDLRMICPPCLQISKTSAVWIGLTVELDGTYE